MSTPEPPSQNSTPGASDAFESSDRQALPAPSDPLSNGHTAAASEIEPSPSPTDESNDTAADESSSDESSEASSADGSTGEANAEGAAGATGDKKRRRRRRKKKPGQAVAGEGASAEAPEGEASAEGSEDGSEAGDRAEARGPGGKRRDRKAGPPRERPPVNAGDIVFGKILEVTDDAILIDIPGKARAIFDRRELLLPDDDEASRASDATANAPADESASSGHEGTSDATVDAAAVAVADAGEVPAAAAPVDAAGAQAPSTGGSGAVEPSPAPVVEAEPVREPKVPRVILEVGADFIGVVYNDGARGGLVVLTHHPHRAERAKPLVEKAFNDKELVMGLVTGVIKGGIEIDIDGLRAFAPGSHVDLRLGTDLSHLVGKRLPFLVTQYAKRGRDVVLSRRTMLEEEAKVARTEALAKLKIGEEREGIVRSVVPFGAFVDVGGIEGLVPLQEMSHNRADGPSDVFKTGETTRVKVIKIDERGKVWLSHKATIPDPWHQVAQKYATGTRHAGKVVRLQPFGAFVELEPGVDGLIHLADLSIKRIETPDEVTKVGEAIDVVVAHLDTSNHKIALHPAPQGDAINETPQRVAPHKAIKAKIVMIEAGGLVVRVLGVTGRNARGYVTAAGTGTPRGTELRKVFNMGQEIDAKVIEMDPRRGEVKLSIKALSEDQERNAYQQYRQQLKAEARFTFGDLLAKKVTPPR